MRKLGSIQKIKKIEKIKGADNIELVTILGWEVIIKKDEFKVGDLCVYIEIDSMLPEKPEFEFLRPKKFQIKTFKLGKFGVVSQGIAFPISILPKKQYKIDEDVTDIIGIKKYDPEKAKELKLKKKKNPIIKFLYRFKLFRHIMSKFKSKESFPSFIPKTDETRLQSIPRVLHSDDMYYVTEKLDGQSGTISKNKGKHYVCSRNLWLKKNNDSSYWKMYKKYNLKDKLNRLNRNIAIQGEIIGPKIQKNKYNLKELDFYVFLIYNIDTRQYLNLTEMISLCKKLGLKMVPIINDNFKLKSTVKEMVEMSKGSSKLYNTKREGLVFRSTTYGHKSFKAINPDFLLKHKI